MEQSGGRLAFGGAGGLRQAGLDHEPVAVLGERVAHVAELGLLALAFAEQACLRVGDRGVCRVRPLLPVEVDLLVATLALGLGPVHRGGVLRRVLAVALGRCGLGQCRLGPRSSFASVFGGAPPSAAGGMVS